MIFVVEDDPNIRELVTYTLQSTGFDACGFENGSEFLKALSDGEKPELVLLDIMLPGEDGISILGKLRKKSATRDLPIIMMTAKGTEYDKVLGLDSGADDYITKPFKPSLLYAKCLALLKRNKKIETNQLQSGKVILDLDKHILVIEENDIVLTDKEFKLLRYLMKNQGIVLSREKILDTLWGYDYYGDGRAVDTYIKRLRKRLGKYSYYIQTIVKTGYMWKGEES